MQLQFLVFIFLYYVYYVLGGTTFIPEGQRAEIFELTDNEVPVFRITLSNDEYNLLKRKASFMDTDDFKKKNDFIKEIIEIINSQNFTEIYPGYNFKEILPELPMNENGHPNIDYENFYIGVNDLYYIDFVNIKKSFYNIFKRNSYLNLVNVFHTLNNLDISSKVDKTFMGLIQEFGIEDETVFGNPEDNSENTSINNDYFGYYYKNNNDNNNHDYYIHDYYVPSSNGQNYVPPTFGQNYDSSSAAWDYNSYNSQWDSGIVLNFDSSWNFDLSNTGWDNGLPNSDVNYDSSIADSGYDSSSDFGVSLDFDSSWDFGISWDFDSSWFFDLPSSDWNDDSSGSGWNYNSLDSNSYYGFQDVDSDYDSLNNIDDNDSSFNFINFYHEFFKRPSKDDDDSNSANINNIVPNNDNQNINFDIFNTKDFYEYFNNYDFDKNNDNKQNINGEENEFKTKNATLIVDINNEKKTFDKITFSLAGSYSRKFAKPGYNIKIRGGKELFGRRQFKLRSDTTEPTYMRTKLVSDIRNRIGMPSLSANYATLYINDEYLGLFILTDIYKESWIEYVYGEKDTQLLYKCNFGSLDYQSRLSFENENKEATNKKELYEFLAEMTKAKSASDIESIFDLDQYYKEIAVDVLVSSWDHTAHNYYIYKNKKNNKWIYMSHDYDLDMGRDEGPSMSLSYLKMYSSTITKLIPRDDPRFRETIKEIVSNVFNPAILYPHIDEIKSFIKPYVELDKTPDENGQYPGRLNKFASDFFTFKNWEDSVEFKSLQNGENNDIYALKKFILLKYRIICQEYELECDPIYLDRNYGRTINVTDNLIDDEKDQSEVDFEN